MLGGKGSLFSQCLTLRDSCGFHGPVSCGSQKKGWVSQRRDTRVALCRVEVLFCEEAFSLGVGVLFLVRYFQNVLQGVFFVVATLACSSVLFAMFHCSFCDFERHPGGR